VLSNQINSEAIMIDEEDDVMKELFLKAFNDLENASIVRLGSLDVSPDINNYLI
jgi:hypothetical protein